jgi:hypothetical protein
LGILFGASQGRFTAILYYTWWFLFSCMSALENKKEAHKMVVAGNESPNHIYYFKIGAGRWAGTFDFSITEWPKFRTATLGFTNRLLALAMNWAIRYFGNAKIASHIIGHPKEGQNGIAQNLVIIRIWGIVLYRLQERYILNLNGRDVWVESHERFGPIPFLFNNKKQHPAEILDNGMRSVYYIPLLGAQWIGRYVVQEDCNHIHATLTCDWAVGHEVIHRVD